MTLERLEVTIFGHREALAVEVDHAVLKQRLLGQIDALDWVLDQIQALFQEDEEPIPLVPTQPPLPPIPPHVQEILDGLQRAGEDYHVSTSGAKVYVRRDGMWINATKTSNVTSTSTSTVKMQWETKDF
jgi:hypothetical protein